MWNGSHIHSKHIKGVWQPSYALDGDMDLPSCHYHHTCQSRFGKSTIIQGHCWMKPLCIGWGPKPMWNGSHIHSKHIQDVWQSSHAVNGDMDPSSCHSLPPHLPVQIWKVSQNPGSLLGAEWSLYAVVQAPNPCGMTPTSPPNVYKVFDNHHMLWMGIWIHHHAIYHHTCRSRFGKAA